MEPLKFKYDEARKALIADGLNEQEADYEIASFLSQQSGFKFDEALNAGASLQDVISFHRRGGQPDDTSGIIKETAKGIVRGLSRMPGQLASAGEALSVDLNTSIPQPSDDEYAAADQARAGLKFKELPKETESTEWGGVVVDPIVQQQRIQDGGFIAPDVPYVKRDTATVPELEQPFADPSTDIGSVRGVSGIARQLYSRLSGEPQPTQEDVMKLYQHIRETAASIPEPEQIKDEYQRLLVTEGEAAAQSYQTEVARRISETMPEPDRLLDENSWVMQAPALLAKGLTEWGENYLYEHPELDMSEDTAQATGLGDAKERGVLTRYIAAHGSESLPQMVASMGITVAASWAGAPVLGVAISTSMMGALEAGSSYQELIKMGASKEDAADLSVVVGAVNGILEQLPIEGLVHGGGGVMFRKLLGKKVMKALAAKPMMARRVLNGLIGGVGQMPSEGGTEWLQEIVGNSAKAVIDENQSLFEGAPTAAVIGAVMGGFSGAIAGAIKNPYAKEVNQSLEETHGGGQLRIDDINQSVNEAGSYLAVAEMADDSDVGDYARMVGKKKYKKEFKQLLKDGAIDKDGKLIELETADVEQSTEVVGSQGEDKRDWKGDLADARQDDTYLDDAPRNEDEVDDFHSDAGLDKVIAEGTEPAENDVAVEGAESSVNNEIEELASDIAKMGLIPLAPIYGLYKGGEAIADSLFGDSDSDGPNNTDGSQEKRQEAEAAISDLPEPYRKHPLIDDIKKFLESGEGQEEVEQQIEQETEIDIKKIAMHLMGQQVHPSLQKLYDALEKGKGANLDDIEGNSKGKDKVNIKQHAIRLLEKAKEKFLPAQEVAADKQLEAEKGPKAAAQGVEKPVPGELAGEVDAEGKRRPGRKAINRAVQAIGDDHQKNLAIVQRLNDRLAKKDTDITPEERKKIEAIVDDLTAEAKEEGLEIGGLQVGDTMTDGANVKARFISTDDTSLDQKVSKVIKPAIMKDGKQISVAEIEVFTAKDGSEADFAKEKDRDSAWDKDEAKFRELLGDDEAAIAKKKAAFYKLNTVEGEETDGDRQTEKVTTTEQEKERVETQEAGEVKATPAKNLSSTKTQQPQGVAADKGKLDDSQSSKDQESINQTTPNTPDSVNSLSIDDKQKADPQSPHDKALEEWRAQLDALQIKKRTQLRVNDPAMEREIRIVEEAIDGVEEEIENKAIEKIRTTLKRTGVVVSPNGVNYKAVLHEDDSYAYETIGVDGKRTTTADEAEGSGWTLTQVHDKIADQVRAELVATSVKEKSDRRASLKIHGKKDGTQKKDVDEEINNLDDDAFDALADQVEAELEAKEKAAAKPKRDPKVKKETAGTAKIKRPKNAAKSTTDEGLEKGGKDILAGVAKSGYKGMDNVTKGLVELFGGPDTLKSFPAGLDKESYAKAKPYFIEGLNNIREAGDGVKEFIEWVFTNIGKAARPYLKHFVQEVRAGKLDNDNTSAILNDKEPTLKEETKGGNSEQAGVPEEDRNNDARDDAQPVAESSQGAHAGVQPETAQASDRPGDVGREDPANGGESSGGDRVPQKPRVPTPRSGINGNAGSSSDATGTPGGRVLAPANVTDKNHSIEADDDIGKGGEIAKYNDNVAAIKLLKEITTAQRRATSEEKKILSRYVGWGGLANAFRNSVTSKVAKGWDKRVAEIESLLSQSELDVARNSTQAAHYTSPTVVKSIWKIVNQLGFKGGNVLEPSMGIGNFLGLMPKGVSGKSNIMGVEYDPVTAALAKLLYPQAGVFHNGFEKTALPSNAFDLVVGNPPFGKQRLNFKYKPHLNRFSIHNQFMLAGVDALKPGGIQVFVVSRYFMDAQTQTARKKISESAKLIGAIRLPDTAFKENARTDVVTDIIILQKKTEQEIEADRKYEKDYGSQRTYDWVETTTVADPMGGEHIPVNRHFMLNPGMVVGSLERSGSMRIGGDITVTLEKGANLAKEIDQRIQQLAKEIVPQRSPAQKAKEQFEAMRENIFLRMEDKQADDVIFTSDGKLSQVYEKEAPGSNDYLFVTRELSEDSPWHSSLKVNSDGKWYEERDKLDRQGKKVKVLNADGKPTKRNVKETIVYKKDSDVPKTKRLGELGFKRLGDAVKLRELLKTQLNMEIDDNSSSQAIEANRKLLKQAYTDFVDEHGEVNSQIISRMMNMLPDGALVQSLEIKYKKPISEKRAKELGVDPRGAIVETADILEKRVRHPYKIAEKVDNVSDALMLSLAETAGVDLERMSELTGKSEAEIIDELHDKQEKPLIYFNPEGNKWETSGMYLSGLVVKKLEAAKEAGLERNVKDLEGVQPEKWDAGKVTVALGNTWIPEAVYSDFVSELSGDPNASIEFSKATNTFVVRGEASSSTAAPWNTPRRNVIEIISAVLNSKSIRITSTGLDGVSRVDQSATDAANEKAQEVKDRFIDWAFEDGTRRTNLVDLFNKQFNIRQKREFDGQHLTLEGKVPDDIIKMRTHQNNAIWRGIVEDSVLYDHAVGAGKTFTAVARAMERKRLGLSNKPMIVVPNHIVDQFSNEAYKLYPGAKILTLGSAELSKTKRRKMFSRIATGDWDMVILPHSSFEFINISPETEEGFLQDELVLALDALAEAEEIDAEENPGGRGKSLSVKAAEALRDRILARLEKVAAQMRRGDNLLTFEQMGVDDLTIDESHEFKNLFYNSSLNGVSGMGSREGSGKAFDLWVKTRVLRESGGSMAFMTGTPISNSAVEMYTILRYLAPEQLDDLGLSHFDAWRSQYATVSTSWEPTESGAGLKEVNRLGRDWSNMRSLMELYNSVADSISNEDIQRMHKEETGEDFPIPKVMGEGDRRAINVSPTENQLRLIAENVAGFEGLPSLPFAERSGERLRLMDQARKLSLDARAMEPGLQSDEAGGKLDVATGEIKRIYDKWTEDKGTQLVFLDRSVPKNQADTKRLKEYEKVLAKVDKANARGDEKALRSANDRLEKFDRREMEELKVAQRSNWNAYQQIKDNLIAQGVPENEIKFVGDAKNAEQKQDLFDEVNSGAVRILLGSTPKMGAGTNVQERLVAIHHIDVTWKPSDIEQREGRIIRQGNRLLDKYGSEFEVEIIAYTTDRTIDAKFWDLNSSKLKMINGIRKYDGEFNMEFDDEASVGMAEIAAIASGNPLQLERVKLSSEVDKLERNRTSHNRQIWGHKDNLNQAKRAVDANDLYGKPYSQLEAEIKTAGAEIEARAKDRAVTVNGKTFKHKEIAQALDLITKEKERLGKKFSIQVAGKKYSSVFKAEEAIANELGDGIPFEGEVDGDVFTRQHTFKLALDSKVAKILDKFSKVKDIESVHLGTVKINGIEFEASVEGEKITRGKAKGEYLEVTLGKEITDTEGRNYPAIHQIKRVTVEKGDADTLQHLTGWIVSQIDGLPKTISTMAAAAKDGKEKIPVFEGLVNKPWSKQEEYDEKNTRLSEVERELSGSAAEAQPVTGDQDETVAFSRREKSGKDGETLTRKPREGASFEPGESTKDSKRLERGINRHIKKHISGGETLPAGTVTESRTGAQGVSNDISEPIQKAGRIFKKKIVFVHNSAPELFNFDGVRMGDTLYIADDTERPHMTLFGHELMESIYLQDEDLYGQFLFDVQGLMQNFDDYRTKYIHDLKEGESIPDDDSITKELIADFTGDQMMNQEFWDGLHDANPTLFKKIAGTIKKFLQKVMNHLKFRGLGSSQYFKDVKAARDAVVKAVAEYGKRQQARAVVKEKATSDEVAFSRKGDKEDNPSVTLEKISDKVTGGPDTARDIETDRLFTMKIFEYRDVEQKRINVKTGEMEKEIQRLAGTPGKDSPAARQLSMAMMVYRDLKRYPLAEKKFRYWAEQELSREDIKAVEARKLKEKGAILDLAKELTSEQRKFVNDTMDKAFGEIGERAKAAGLVDTLLENYVRRLWALPDSVEKATGLANGYGFKVGTTASWKRTLDTILDGWVEGYELKVQGIHNSFDQIGREVAGIEANLAFIIEGRKTKDLEGNSLFTTKKRDGMVELKASGFTVYVAAGTVEGTVLEDADQVDFGEEDRLSDDFLLEVNNFGRKVFVSKPKMEDGTATSIVFEPRQLMAPKALADMINKATSRDTLFPDTPVLETIEKINMMTKGWILISSFFHHLAGSRSWVFGVHHGGKINPVSAYKRGLKKIEGFEPIFQLGVKHGLTTGLMQDFDEGYFSDDSIFESIFKKLDMDKSLQGAEWLKRKREGFTGSLFKKFFAGLKAEAFAVEFTHELQNDPTQDQDRLAERIATLINADFGGLHLQRMGRNPTLQKVARLLLLSPDWTESNFRTVTGMIPGLNKTVSKIMGEIPPPPGMDKVYRKFWYKVIFAATVATIIPQMLINGRDEDDREELMEFYKEQFSSYDQFRRLRWTQIDITKLYNLLGVDLKDNQRKTFSVVGHFADPLKIMDIDKLVKHKGSPVVRIKENFLSGTDWAGRPFTGTKELAVTGKTVKKSRFQKTEDPWGRLPSTLIASVKGVLPIQANELISYMMGELDGLSALMTSAGAHVSNTWIPDMVGDEYKELRSTVLKADKDFKAFGMAGKREDGAQMLADEFGSVRAFKVLQNNYGFTRRALTGHNKKLKALRARDDIPDRKERIKEVKAKIHKLQQGFIDKYKKVMKDKVKTK